jgi:hypothetical protein
VLLTANAKSARRVDFSNTPLRSALAWVGRNDRATEEVLRALAITILTREERYLQLVDGAVETVATSEDLGFTVNRAELEPLYLEASRNLVGLASAEPGPAMMGPFGAAGKQELARHLSRHRLPQAPSGEAPLVLVSRFQSRQFAKEHGVWRALGESQAGWSEIAFRAETQPAAPTPAVPHGAGPELRKCLDEVIERGSEAAREGIDAAYHWLRKRSREFRDGGSSDGDL